VQAFALALDVGPLESQDDERRPFARAAVKNRAILPAKKQATMSVANVGSIGGRRFRCMKKSEMYEYDDAQDAAQ
jgi:hypothetical protein